jgi:site-specific recombinase XerC
VFAKLLEAASGLPRTARRNEAILSVLFDVGPRLSEFVAIDREDVFLDAGYVMVQAPGKNGKRRPLPLGRTTRRVLRAHLGRSKGTGPVFVGERGKRMTSAAVRQVLARLSVKARVPRVFPHAFRHEASAWYTTLGATASAKDAVFGWKPDPRSMDATYTFLTTEQVVLQHQARSPLDHFVQSTDRARRAA